jgi:hypothetical protein
MRLNVSERSSGVYVCSLLGGLPTVADEVRDQQDDSPGDAGKNNATPSVPESESERFV